MITNIDTKLNLADLKILPVREDQRYEDVVVHPRAIKSSGEPDDGMYKIDDPEYMKPRKGYVSTVYVFDLAKKEDLNKYTEQLNLVGSNHFFTIRHTERRWDDTIGNWKILLEILEHVDIAPDKIKE